MTEPWLYSVRSKHTKILPSFTLFAVLRDLFWLVFLTCYTFLLLAVFYIVCKSLCSSFRVLSQESDQEMTVHEKIDQLLMARVS